MLLTRIHSRPRPSMRPGDAAIQRRDRANQEVPRDQRQRTIARGRRRTPTRSSQHEPTGRADDEADHNDQHEGHPPGRPGKIPAIPDRNRDPSGALFGLLDRLTPDLSGPQRLALHAELDPGGSAGRPSARSSTASGGAHDRVELARRPTRRPRHRRAHGPHAVRVRCPAHDDNRPSLSLRERGDPFRCRYSTARPGARATTCWPRST